MLVRACQIRPDVVVNEERAGVMNETEPDGFCFRYTTSKPWQEVAALVEKRCRELGYGVLHQYTLSDLFRLRGQELANTEAVTYIISFCDPKMGKRVVDINSDFACLFPCRAAVCWDGSKTTVTIGKPSAMVTAFDDERLRIFEEVEDDLATICEDATS